MKPIKTESTNSILKPPEGDKTTIELPITRLISPEGFPAVESCWELSKEELEEINKTGRIYFICMGKTHPPILLSTESLAKD